MSFDSKKTVISWVFARNIDLNQVLTVIDEEYEAKKIKEVVRISARSGEAWIFEFGVIVFWGVELPVREKLFKEIVEVCEAHDVMDEEMLFEISGQDFELIDNELLLLGEDSHEKLAISYALAQSVKLSYFEEIARQVIEKHSNIAKSLEKYGKTQLSAKQIAKIRGALFGVKSDILINYNLLDTPEFFWRNPEYESVYLKISKYLDVDARINVLTKKLETIHELLEMLVAEQHHKHSSMLEWIVIVLIAVEVFMFFAQEAKNALS